MRCDEQYLRVYELTFRSQIVMTDVNCGKAA